MATNIHFLPVTKTKNKISASIYLLRLVSDGGAPHPGILELRDQLFVQLVTEVLDTWRLVV